MKQWFRKHPNEAPAAGTKNGDISVALARKLITYLESQISSPKRATAIMSQIARFKELPPTYQQKELPALYLKIEKYLTEQDPLQKFTRSQLRKTVRYRYEALMELFNFKLIFEPREIQEILLSQQLLKNVLLQAVHDHQNNGTEFLNEIGEWLYRIPDVFDRPIPFQIADKLPDTPEEWVPLLIRFSHKLYSYFEEVWGERYAASLYDKSYRELAENYSALSSFSVIIQLLPDKLLDTDKIGLLNSEQLRSVFLRKLNHLKRVNDELMQKNEELQEAKDELTVAQDTAIESIRLFHAVLNTVDEGIVTIDEQGKIILANEYVLNMFGYKEAELVGKNVQVLMPNKYREQHQKGMERYLKKRRSRALGQRLLLEGLRKDHTIFPLEITITESQVSTHIFFTAAMRDISQDLKQEHEHKKIAEELRISEHRLKSFVQASPDIVFTLSLDGNFTFLNPAFEKITGWKIEEWIEKPFTRLIHPDNAPKVLRIFQNVLQGESPQPLELRYRLKSDKYAVGEFVIKPQHVSGKIAGAIGVARDITRLKKLEGAVRLSEKNYRRVLEDSPEAVAIYRDGELLFVNREFARLMGASDFSQLVHQQLLDFIHPDDLLSVKDLLDHLKEENSLSEMVSVKIRLLNGSELEAELMGTPVYYEAQKAVRLILRTRHTPVADSETVTTLNAQFQKLVKSTSQAILIQNVAGMIMDANSAALELLGAGDESLVGKSFLQFIPEEQKEATIPQLNALFEEDADTFQTKLLRFDEQEVEVDVQAFFIKWNGKPATLINLTDIADPTLSKREKILQFAEVKKLRNRLKQVGELIPVCASCQQIRDDERYWQQLEEFIAERGNVTLLRGICPECAAQNSHPTVEHAKNGTK